MRVLRVVAGVVSLLLALPVLAAGILGWWTMQHRSPDGAFHAAIAPIDAPGRVVVVPDLDAILRRDAPIARADRTALRLATPGFIGIARPADVAAYLARADYTAVEGVSLGRGSLQVRMRHISTGDEQPLKPQDQDFWVRRGEGELVWTPSVDRDQQVALVIVAPAGEDPIHLTASVSAGWLASTTWGLLILGPVLTLLGLTALAWPARRREIVYIMGDGTVAATSLVGRVSGHAVIQLPSQSQVPDAAPDMPWPPIDSVASTEPPRDLPMPLAGDHRHLIKK